GRRVRVVARHRGALPGQNLIPFSARCFHHLYAKYAAGTAASAPAVVPTRTPAAIAPAVEAPATIPFLRDSSRTSERVLLMAERVDTQRLPCNTRPRLAWARRKTSSTRMSAPSRVEDPRGQQIDVRR